jgi:protein-tyrosine phosphatase
MASPALIPKASRITDAIYIGAHAAAREEAPLRAAGITHVVDLTVHGIEAEKVRHKGLRYHHVKILDQPGADLGRHFQAAADFIQKAHDAHGAVLVHCLHGKSRSASTVMAFLLLHSGLALDAAHALCKKGRPQIDPNVGFMLQLCALEQRLRGATTVDPARYGVEQLYKQVQLGFISCSSRKPLARRHCEEAITRNPIDTGKGLCGAIDWLEETDPDDLPAPPEPEPETTCTGLPKWGEKGWQAACLAPVACSLLTTDASVAHQLWKFRLTQRLARACCRDPTSPATGAGQKLDSMWGS